MVGHGGSSAGSYLADPTSPIPSHCASIVMTSTVRVNNKHVSFGMKNVHVQPEIHLLVNEFLVIPICLPTCIGIWTINS